MTSQNTHQHAGHEFPGGPMQHGGHETHKKHRGMMPNEHPPRRDHEPVGTRGMDHGEHEMHGKHEGHEGMAHMGHRGSGGGDHHAHMVADFGKRFWNSLILTVFILVLSPLIQSFFGWRDALKFPGDIYILWAFSTAVFFYGGRPFLKGFFSEMAEKKPAMMTLISIAITVAYAYSSIVVFGLRGKVFFWELATLIDIMLLGHWIEMKSIMGASRALEELARIMPATAHKIASDGTKEVSLDELNPGDKVIVKPGEKISADGTVVEGKTSVNEAMLTGEWKPVEKQTGDPVIGGAINAEGSITVEVKKTGKDSFLSQVIELVRQAQQSKSKTQDLADRAALWLTIIALVIISMRRARRLSLSWWTERFREPSPSRTSSGRNHMMPFPGSNKWASAA